MTEPNNNFNEATVVPDIYLEQNFYTSDSVSPTDLDDYYKFYTLYGPSTLYAPLNGLSADADIYLYDQNQNLVASSTLSSNQSETINASLQGNQYYYIKVHSYNASNTTNYGLYLYNDYSGPTLATARDIGTSWGQSSSKYLAYNKIGWQDYLDYRDNVDVVKFTMEAPGTISLRMKDFTYTGGLQARMQLLDSSGNVLQTVSGTVGNGLNVDRYSAPAGIYYVKYTQTYGSDPYTLRIVTDYAGDVTGTARDLGNLSGTSRRLYDMVGGPSGPTYEDANDLYKFTLDKTSPIDLRLDIDTFAFPTPTFDADLRLARDTNNDGFISSGEVFLSSSNPGDDQLSTTLGAGTYYVQVVPNGAYTNYQLDLDSDFDAVNSDPQPYNNLSKARSLGALIGETPFDLGDGFGISAGDFSDYFKFTMTAAGKLSASAFNNPYYSRTSQNPTLSIVRDSNNNQRLDAGETITPFSVGSLTANLAAGTYFLHTNGTGEQAAYNLRLVSDYAGNTLSTARPLVAIAGATPPNQTFQDYIEQFFDASSDVNDFYRFDLPNTYEVTLNTTGVAGEDLSLSLIKDVNNNNVIDAGDILATSNALNSPTETLSRVLGAGRYFARVQGVNGSTNYTLTSKFVSPSQDPDDTIAEVQNRTGNIKTLGQFADFSLNPQIDVDLVKFTVSAGQRVGFDVDSRNGSNLNTYLRVFSSNGTQLAANNDGAAPSEASSQFSYLAYTFTQAGTYYVGVSFNPNSNYNPVTGLGDVAGSGATGDYRLTLNNLGLVLTGDGGNNAIAGGSGNDNLSGAGGNDTLTGGAGNDVLIGGTGNDLLVGGAGNDALTGGDGADVYRFTSGSDRLDTINGFSGSGGDKIQISAVGFGGGLVSSSLSSDRFRSGAGITTANTTTQRFIYNTTNGAFFFDADGSLGGSAPLQIAALSGNPALSNTNIVVM
ncbi:pre-peptidase C-terminal domain-containing protein [Nostoc sp. ChiQUE01b]|uniref:pre-peptidase C-terminal domain-containing protein n=1 Tax=Nostoc sp. ChiQUE01b TaxID=3075376 RepID=UPI002AD3F089|nr:pre-peptidase C-terminal domain-containing protein [Nostoc sp. ChiQUE01b]MDZ8261766.1 pre-peptidase C-terminal domain-containing protein [Nostoc sp. ChiQUE01b]